jgi:hypothetical protein
LEQLRPDLVQADDVLHVEAVMRSWDPVIIMGENKGVTKRTMGEGQLGERPLLGARVKVAFTGKLLGGKVFEEHTANNPLELCIDEGESPTYFTLHHAL